MNPLVSLELNFLEVTLEQEKIELKQMYRQQLDMILQYLFDLHQLTGNVEKENVEAKVIPLNPEPPQLLHKECIKRRANLIQEWIDTERTYVKELGCLLSLYVTPSAEILASNDYLALFSNISLIYDFLHLHLLPLLQNNQEGFGKVLNQTLDYFKSRNGV